MPAAGDRIGEYVLLSELGSGGFGSVWLADDKSQGHKVALKVLHPDLFGYRVGNKGPSVSERFVAEARLLQKLDHPGIVKIYSVIDEPSRGLVAYVMEALQGGDLARRAPTLDLCATLGVFVDVAETLAFLHGNNVIHRDVKASNVFIIENGGSRATKLLDFGAAKELHADAVLASTATGTFLGSVSWMAPESFSRWDGPGKELSGALDQWSVGVTLYHVLTAHMPFRDETLVGLINKIEHDEPEPLVMLERFGCPQTPPAIDAVVGRCLKKDPKDRYPDMAALRVALGALVDGGEDDTYAKVEAIRGGTEVDAGRAGHMQFMLPDSMSMADAPTGPTRDGLSDPDLLGLPRGHTTADDERIPVLRFTDEPSAQPSIPEGITEPAHRLPDQAATKGATPALSDSTEAEEADTRPAPRTPSPIPDFATEASTIGNDRPGFFSLPAPDASVAPTTSPDTGGEGRAGEVVVKPFVGAAHEAGPVVSAKIKWAQEPPPPVVARTTVTRVPVLPVVMIGLACVVFGLLLGWFIWGR